MRFKLDCLPFHFKPYLIMQKKSLLFTILISLFALISVEASGQYCEATGAACGTENKRSITNFGITYQGNGLLHNESLCDAYGDFTDLATIKVIKGNTYEIYMSFLPFGIDMGTVYIDFNADGEFTALDEAFEMTGSGGIYSGSFVVPPTAVSGLSRLRVVVNGGIDGTPSCGVMATGEVEDYSLLISDGPDNVDEYCNSAGAACIDPSDPPRHIETYTIYDATQNVVFTKGSGCSTTGYSDFTSDIIELTAGEAYNGELITSASNAADQIVVLIDIDGDKTFVQANEYFKIPGNAGLFTGVINIPTDAPSGLTRMRVVYKWSLGGSPSAAGCGKYNIGETEDYTVNIINSDAPSNESPTAANDNAKVNQDAFVDIDVKENDQDSDGTLDATSVTITKNTLNGATSVNGTNGVITYTPNTGFSGNDTLKYTIKDDAGDASNEASVFVIINGKPIATEDNANTFTEQQVNIAVLENDNDDNKLDTPSLSISTVATNGTATLKGDGTIDYVSNASFLGLDTFFYSICDTATPALCDIGMVIIAVAEPNTPPTAIKDNANTQSEVLVNIEVLKNDMDPEGIDTSSLEVISDPSNGTAVVKTNGTIDYTSNAAFVGKDTFQYAICGKGDPLQCDSAIVVVTVSEVGNTNTPPIVTNDTVQLDEDTEIDIYVLSNDSDPENNLDSNSIEIVTAALNGVLNINSDFSINYKPNENYFGKDSFIYSVCDGETPELCEQAKVIITIVGVGDAPIANDDYATGREWNDIPVDFLSNDINQDGNINNDATLIYEAPKNGSATFNPGKTLIIYKANSSFFGLDTLYYSICNDAVPALCDSAFVEILVDGFMGIGQNNLLEIDHFPNPVINSVNISSSIPFSGVISIFDFSGKLILKRSLSIPGVLNLEILKSGIYLMEVRDSGSGDTNRSKVIKK
ncbi:MAG: hypothetical protein ACI81S_000755 [Sphingobacteriales bacterium]